MQQSTSPYLEQQPVRRADESNGSSNKLQNSHLGSVRQTENADNNNVNPSLNGMLIHSSGRLRTSGITNKKLDGIHQVQDSAEKQPGHLPTLETLSLSSLLSCEELLDLYSNTRTNFLEAEHQLKNIGNVAVEVYQELDAVQKHLNYKSDHYYYQLINASRSSPDFLSKLREKVKQKRIVSKPSTISNKSRTSEPEYDSDSDIELLEKTSTSREDPDYDSRGSSKKHNGASSKASKTIEESSRQKPTGNKSNQFANNNNESALSHDMQLYLEKVAQLRGDAAAQLEAERLRKRSQPLERVAASPQTILDLNTIINEINTRSIPRDAIVKFFKNIIPSLKSLPSAKVADIFSNLVLGVEKEIYGTQYDARYIITNGFLEAFELGHPFWSTIGNRTKPILRISNWLRNDFSSKKDLNIGYCLSLLDRLHFSLDQLQKYRFSDIPNFIKGKRGKYESRIDKIYKNAQGKVNDQQNNNTAQRVSKLSAAVPVSSTISSFSRRPLPPPSANSKLSTSKPLRPTSTSTVTPTSNQTQATSGSSEKSRPSNPEIKASAKPTSTFASGSIPTPAAPKKWSFGSYVSSTKRKTPGSEPVPQISKPKTSSIEPEQIISNTSSSLKSILTKGSGSQKAKKPKKTVRFSNSNQVREFESEMVIGHGMTPESEHKRAREMETSEGNTLKKHKNDFSDPSMTSEVQAISENKVTTIKHYTVSEYLHRKFQNPPPINFDAIENFSRDEISVTRGGTIPLQLFKDKYKPKWERPKLVRGVNTKPMNPIEPERGLIVELQHLDMDVDEGNKTGTSNHEPINDTSAEISKDRNIGEDQDDDYVIADEEELSASVNDDYVLPDAEESSGPVNDDYVLPDADEASGPVNDDYELGSKSPTPESTTFVASEENNSTDLSNVHETNKNVDQDVLDLLDDADDVFDGHASEDELGVDSDYSTDVEAHHDRVHNMETHGLDKSDDSKSKAFLEEELHPKVVSHDAKSDHATDSKEELLPKAVISDAKIDDATDEVPPNEEVEPKDANRYDSINDVLHSEDINDNNSNDEVIYPKATNGEDDDTHESTAEGGDSTEIPNEEPILGQALMDQTEAELSITNEENVPSIENSPKHTENHDNGPDLGDSSKQDETQENVLDIENTPNTPRYSDTHENGDQDSSDDEDTANDIEEIPKEEFQKFERAQFFNKPEGYTDSAVDQKSEVHENSGSDYAKLKFEPVDNKIFGDKQAADSIEKSSPAPFNDITSAKANIDNAKERVESTGVFDEAESNSKELNSNFEKTDDIPEPQTPISDSSDHPEDEVIHAIQTSEVQVNDKFAAESNKRIVSYNNENSEVRNERSNSPTERSSEHIDNTENMKSTLKVIFPANNSARVMDTESRSSRDSSGASSPNNNEGAMVLKIKGAANEANKKSWALSDRYPQPKRMSRFEDGNSPRKLNTYNKEIRDGVNTHRKPESSIESFYNP